MRRCQALAFTSAIRCQEAVITSLFHQVEINGKETRRDFSGRTVTHAEFASQYKIKIAPVVMFFSATGEQLAAPLVGAMIPEFYGAYFDATLAEAKPKLTPRGGS